MEEDHFITQLHL